MPDPTAASEPKPIHPAPQGPDPSPNHRSPAGEARPASAVLLPLTAAAAPLVERIVRLLLTSGFDAAQALALWSALVERIAVEVLEGRLRARVGGAAIVELSLATARTTRLPEAVVPDADRFVENVSLSSPDFRKFIGAVLELRARREHDAAHVAELLRGACVATGARMSSLASAFASEIEHSERAREATGLVNVLEQLEAVYASARSAGGAA